MEKENSIINQVICDEDFVALNISEFDSFVMVTDFIFKSNIKSDAIKEINAYLEAIRLRPYVNNHIAAKEKILGKSRKYFTEEEKDAVLDKFYKIYKTANKILSGKVNVEEIINETWQKVN